MFSLKLFCFLFGSLIFSTLGLKSWIPNTNMHDKHNWNTLDIPKDCDNILYRGRNGLSLLWSLKDLLVTGLTLPTTGSLMIASDISIRFADKSKCPGARDITYKRDDWKGWLDPTNWKSDDNDFWLPHAERIPCFGEDVKFPPGNSFAVQLPDIMVPVGKIFFGNEELDGDEWAHFLNTGEGRSQFRSEKAVQNPWLHELRHSGGRERACGESAYVFEGRTYKFVSTSMLHESVCLYAKSSCKTVACYSPVLPEGHCCGVCGAVIKVKDKSENDFLLNQIREMVGRKKIDAGGNADFHVGRTLDGNIEIVVLSESSKHTSEALTLAALVKDFLITENFGKVQSAKFSGLALSAYFFNNTSAIIFGTFFTAVFFFASLYFIFVILPKKKVLSMSEHPFRFARFKNTLHEASSEERLEIGAQGEGSHDSRGFQNPTFSTGYDVSAPSSSKPVTQEKNSSISEVETRQEYDNPTYHEMEKSKEFTVFDAKTEVKEEANEETHPFSEIKL